MKISLNGRETDYPARLDVADEVKLVDLLAHLGYAPDAPASYAVAVNLEFVPRARYGSTVVVEGDQVEILSPSAGG